MMILEITVDHIDSMVPIAQMLTIVDGILNPPMFLHLAVRDIEITPEGAEEDDTKGDIKVITSKI